MRVNIYIISSNTAPRRANGRVLYILETITAKGPATKTVKLKFEHLTANESLIYGLHDAIGHISKPCEVIVYTESAYIKRTINEWIHQWSAAGWKRARGREIKHVEKWAQIEGTLYAKPLIATLEYHQYLNWMRNEVLNE